MLEIHMMEDTRREQVRCALLTDVGQVVADAIRERHTELEAAGLTMAACELRQELGIVLLEAREATD